MKAQRMPALWHSPSLVQTVPSKARKALNALAQIFDTHHDSVYRYIRMRVSGDALAEDLSAEVFTRLLQALGKGKGPRDSLRGWLYGVASHCVADHHRRESRARKLDPEVMAPAAVCSSSSATAAPPTCASTRSTWPAC